MCVADKVGVGVGNGQVVDENAACGMLHCNAREDGELAQAANKVRLLDNKLKGSRALRVGGRALNPASFALHLLRTA